MAEVGAEVSEAGDVLLARGVQEDPLVDLAGSGSRSHGHGGGGDEREVGEADVAVGDSLLAALEAGELAADAESLGGCVGGHAAVASEPFDRGSGAIEAVLAGGGVSSDELGGVEFEEVAGMAEDWEVVRELLRGSVGIVGGAEALDSLDQ
jgi:hypothetical protein